MCTAVCMDLGSFYFGRTLDVDRDYGQRVAIAPRNFDYRFTGAPQMSAKFAVIGMAKVEKGYPLFFDAINEKGLCMAGLRFPSFSCKGIISSSKTAVAPFEFIPFVLSTCDSVQEAEILLKYIELVDVAFSENLPITPLHWIISDRHYSLTVESTEKELYVYKNEVGVLTNSPKWPMQMFNLNNYKSLTTKPPQNTFSNNISLKNYSFGLGALGLPGDLSSMSRFVRAVYYKYNIVADKNPETDFFRVINTCFQPKGLTQTEDCVFEYTAYTSCCNADRGVYGYRTYDDENLRRIDMHDFDLDSSTLFLEQKIY